MVVDFLSADERGAAVISDLLVSNNRLTHLILGGSNIQNTGYFEGKTKQNKMITGRKFRFQL